MPRTGRPMPDASHRVTIGDLPRRGRPRGPERVAFNAKLSPALVQELKAFCEAQGLNVNQVLEPMIQEFLKNAKS